MVLAILFSDALRQYFPPYNLLLLKYTDFCALLPPRNKKGNQCNFLLWHIFILLRFGIASRFVQQLLIVDITVYNVECFETVEIIGIYWQRRGDTLNNDIGLILCIFFILTAKSLKPIYAYNLVLVLM